MAVITFSAWGIVPVPWSVPDVGTGVSKKGKRFRFATRSKKSALHKGIGSFEDWQVHVRTSASQAMLEASTRIFTTPVAISVVFVLPTPAGHKHGEIAAPTIEWNEKTQKWSKRGGLADLANLLKGIEDAIEGVVMANDVQTRVIERTAVIWGQIPGAIVTVRELEMSEFPGYGEPVPRLPNLRRKLCDTKRSPKSGRRRMRSAENTDG
jgi:Holliday junction resolvase RusA-like endonuclease